jgi:hypothetical protein
MEHLFRRRTQETIQKCMIKVLILLPYGMMQILSFSLETSGVRTQFFGPLLRFDTIMHRTP